VANARLENISYVRSNDGNFSGEQTEVAVCPENAGQQDISHGDAGNYNGNDGASFTDTGISVSDIDAYYSQMADDIPTDGYGGGMDIPPDDYIPFGQYEDMPSQDDLDMIFGKEGGQTAQETQSYPPDKTVGTDIEKKELFQTNRADAAEAELNGSESCDGCKNSENSGKTKQASSTADGEKEKSAEDKRPPAKKKPVRKTDESVDLPF